MICFALYFFFSWTIASPFPHLVHDSRLRLEGDRRFAIASSTQNSTLGTLRNGSPTVISNDVSCYIPTEGRPIPFATDIHECSIFLSEVPNFPHYYVTQFFIEGAQPLLGHEQITSGTPPFLFREDAPQGSNCAIVLAAMESGAPDVFSWQQVRNVALQILVRCGSPGYGGRKTIGSQGRWFVRLFGWRHLPFPSPSETINQTSGQVLNAA